MSEAEVKVGDYVEILSTCGERTELPFKEGDTVEVKCIGKNNNIFVLDNKTGFSPGFGCPCGKHSWQIKNGSYKLKGTKHKNMNLIQQFRLSMKGEPEKTFIKAGIIDETEKFTSEGKELFNAFLLKKFGDEFKKEIVDPLVIEMEKAEK